jgi:hypothetical protein
MLLSLLAFKKCNGDAKQESKFRPEPKKTFPSREIHCNSNRQKYLRDIHAASWSQCRMLLPQAAGSAAGINVKNP